MQKGLCEVARKKPDIKQVRFCGKFWCNKNEYWIDEVDNYK